MDVVARGVIGIPQNLIDIQRLTISLPLRDRDRDRDRARLDEDRLGYVRSRETPTLIPCKIYVESKIVSPKEPYEEKGNFNIRRHF